MRGNERAKVWVGEREEEEREKNSDFRGIFLIFFFRWTELKYLLDEVGQDQIGSIYTLDHFVATRWV